MHVIQRRGDIEHAAAGRAQHVPRQLEEAELGGVQERGDGALLVEPVRGGKGEHIDAGKLAVGSRIRPVAQWPPPRRHRPSRAAPRTGFWHRSRAKLTAKMAGGNLGMTAQGICRYKDRSAHRMRDQRPRCRKISASSSTACARAANWSTCTSRSTSATSPRWSIRPRPRSFSTTSSATTCRWCPASSAPTSAQSCRSAARTIAEIEQKLAPAIAKPIPPKTSRPRRPAR